MVLQMPASTDQKEAMSVPQEDHSGRGVPQGRQSPGLRRKGGLYRREETYVKAAVTDSEKDLKWLSRMTFDSWRTMAVAAM